MRNIVALVGFIGSGKDTVAKELVRRGYQQFSFAASLKDAVSSIFGWDRELLEGSTEESRSFRETPDMFWSRKLGIDNFTPRLALQLIGTNVLRNHFHENIWLDSLEYRLLKSGSDDQPIVISDARFQNELEMVHRLNGKIVWVRRGELPAWYDTAVLAASGSPTDRLIMETKYANIHVSEWDWVNTKPDLVIRNDSTLSALYEQITHINDAIVVATL